MSIDVGQAGIPNGATFLYSATLNLAATAGSTSITPVAGRLAYLLGFAFHICGATAASIVQGTVGPLFSNVTWQIPLAVPAGVTAGAVPIVVTLPVAIPGQATGTAITITIPSLGAGNTNASAAIWGFML